MSATAAAILKAFRIAAAILQDIFENSGENIFKIIGGVVGIIMLLLFFIAPVVVFERVPVATHEQALWYYGAARAVSESTASPCHDGVYIDWQEVIAIDAFRYRQDFRKSSAKAALELAQKFVEPVGNCTHCTGSGEDQTCSTYTVYRLRSIEEVMADLGLSKEEQETVVSKYRAVDYNFLIGFKPDAAADYGVLYSGKLVWPLPGYHHISNPYGMRVHPILGTQHMHYGIDVPAPAHTEVVVTAEGKIKSVAWSDAVGWTIVIDHGEDEYGSRITTRYFHMMNAKVKTGQTVRAGQVIGEVGDAANTGYLSTGPHLHFEILVDGVNQDPAEYFTRK